MKILVTVKEVGDLEDSFTIEDNAIDDHYLAYDLNEWDDYALEAAVQLSEEHADIEVIAVTIGPERAEETIRMVLAKGADRAIRIWDDTLDDVSYIDLATKADLLAPVVDEEAPDLVLTGVQSGDDANSGTGVALAQRTGYEWAAVVNELAVDPDADMTTVHRELEGGMEEIVDVTRPAVLTIQTGINEPRYASLRGIRQAQRKPIDIRGLDDLGVGQDVVDTPITLTAMFEPEAESDATIWEGDAADTATELAGLLQERGVGDA